MYFFYLFKKYFFNFLLFLFGFAFLFVLIDFMFNVNKLPLASNLKILYLFYNFIYAIFIIYPLAMAFSFLFTLDKMLKFNELVSFYSLGFSHKKIFFPFFLMGTFFISIIFAINFTKYAYANQYAKAIKNSMGYQTKNIFLKFNNKIIYIQTLNPILKKAYNIYVFEVKNRELKSVIFAKEAFFKNSMWHSSDAKIFNLTSTKWEEKIVNNISFLKDFKPKILSNLKTLDNISFYDAYLSIKYFKEIDLNRILSIIFFKVFTPITMLIVIYAIFLNAPIHLRVADPFFMIKSSFLIVFVWGSFLLLFKFAKQGVIPYYLLTLPFILSIFLVIRRRYEF